MERQQQLRDPLPVLLWGRSIGIRGPWTVVNHLRNQQTWRLSLRTDRFNIVSPHRKSISSLSVDKTEGRFLLAGSSDATISIYELSRCGREEYQELGGVRASNLSHRYKPVAQSMRSASNANGHGSSIVRAEWYPFDTGAFISSSTDGNVVVWDTHTMTPVMRWQPLQSISSMHLSRSLGRSESLLAVGSNEDSTIKIVDIRSGAASHSLVGHTRGLTSLQWSPTCDIVLASGSLDGSVRLWDVRQAGSRANIAALDQEMTSAYPLRPFQPDYRHLRRRQPTAVPNTYRDNQTTLSHTGPVTGISFTPNGQYMLSCGGRKLQMWDLRSTGHLTTLPFVTRDTAAASILQSQEHQVWVAGHGTKICAFSLELGGRPSQVLEGHLGRVTALHFWGDTQSILSGANDGMILYWSSPS
jgi:DNA excision repair protein ERCC-8